VEKLHSLRNIDITFWKIYTQGEWAQPQELIFQNWKVTKDSTFWYRGEKEIVYGLDFGFVYPTALIRIEWDRRDNLFLAEEIYETKLTNSELITLMKARNIPNNIPIYADPEDPGRIQEIAEAGFNIQPAIRTSPKEGIRYLQEFNLYISSQAGNILIIIRFLLEKFFKNPMKLKRIESQENLGVRLSALQSQKQLQKIITFEIRSFLNPDIISLETLNFFRIVETLEI